MFLFFLGIACRSFQCTKGSGNPIYPLIFIFIFFSFYFWVQQHPNSFYDTVHGYCSHSPWTVPMSFMPSQFIFFLLILLLMIFCLFLFSSFSFWVQKHPNSFSGTVHVYCSHSPWTVPDGFRAFVLIVCVCGFFFLKLHVHLFNAIVCCRSFQCTKGSGNPIYPLIFIFIFFFLFLGATAP